MNTFDAAGLAFFNYFAFQSPLFDSLMVGLSQQYLYKGVVLVSLLWFVWYLPDQSSGRGRQIAVMSILGGLLGLLIARLLTTILPFRNRPVYNESFPLRYPEADPSQYLESWSAFPSDHAMLWFAIAVGIFLIHRRAGILAMLYTILFICVPRIYLGLHHPTDIIGGAVMGTILVLACCAAPVRQRIAGPLVQWSYRHPPSFYMIAFALTYGLTTHYYEIKGLLGAVAGLIR